MPDPDDSPRRRRTLVLDITQAASEVSRLVHEDHDLNPTGRDGGGQLPDSDANWTPNMPADQDGKGR